MEDIVSDTPLHRGFGQVGVLERQWESQRSGFPVSRSDVTETLFGVSPFPPDIDTGTAGRGLGANRTGFGRNGRALTT
jgi:hypothetical protein